MDMPATDNRPLEIIDVWAQPPVPGFTEGLPEVAPLLRRSGTSGISGQSIGPEELVGRMDAAGVSRMFLCAWHRPGRVICSNDEVAAYVRTFPDRFVGVASVDLEHPVAAVRELDRAVNELGFRALRVVPWLWKLPPNDRLYYPLYVKCVELDIPFCTQIGHTGPLMPSETGRPVPYLDDVLLTFPELKVLGGHMGVPWLEETIGMLMKHANFYIDTSAHLPKTFPRRLLDYMKTIGRTKVLYGTNYPQLDIAKCAAQARRLPLSPKALRGFLSENARRLFRIEG